MMEQTEAVENRSVWTGEGPHWFLSVWVDGSSVQAKLKSLMYRLQAHLVFGHLLKTV